MYNKQVQGVFQVCTQFNTQSHFCKQRFFYLHRLATLSISLFHSHFARSFSWHQKVVLCRSLSFHSTTDMVTTKMGSQKKKRSSLSSDARVVPSRAV